MSQDPPRIATRLRHAGNEPARQSGAVNPPLVRASTVVFDSLDALEAATARPFDGFFYGRFGTPTHAALGEALNAISGAGGCVFYPSGLAAIAGVLLSFLHPGDELLLADCAYGPTRGFCQSQLAGLGIRTRLFPADAGGGIEELIGEATRLIFCESPGSLTMELQDLPAICAAAQRRGVPVVVDNTWATPLHCRVLDLGAAVDIQAATKYLAGHADLMLGAALCNAQVFEQVRRTAMNHGYCVSPDDAWQTLRGLRTLDLRLRQQAANARQVGDWLAAQPEVIRLLDPARPDHPQHALWRRDFTGANGLFSVEFRPLSRAQLAAFTDGLEFFGLGYSWGGYESLCLPFAPGGQRSLGDWSGRGTFVRLHIGLEDPRDLIADLAAGLARLRSVDT